jgi:hypothetical protein
MENVKLKYTGNLCMIKQYTLFVNTVFPVNKNI